MLLVEWGEHEGRSCLRFARPGLDGPLDARQVRVYPTEAASQGTAGLPPVTGHYGVDGHGLWFVPRFGFVPGASYTVVWQDQVTVLDRPADAGAATTTVQAIYPTAGSVLVNQLRLYVHFSAPMSEGFASAHVEVRDAASGEQLADALLETTEELWDRDRRRLTLLFDPGRIKRGLAAHRNAGYPLVPGNSVDVVVDARFPDALGRPLAAGFARRYGVGPAVRGHVDPSSWTLRAPRARSMDPFVVDFDRPLDHGLLQHSLSVHGPGADAVGGSVGIGTEERSWALFPAREWAPGAYRLGVDHRLEDMAGNSVSRVFDRDLSDPHDDPRPARAVTVPFLVREHRGAARQVPRSSRL